MASGLEIANMMVKLSADVSDLTKGFDLAEKKMSSFEKGMGGLQSAVGAGLKVAAGIGVAAVGGLAMGIGHAVTKAADMEQGIANIAAAMQLGSEETAELKDLIMDLGLDPKLKVTAVEAAQAIEVLGTAGLTLDEILQGAARSTVLLANSTGADFAQAGAIASDVMAQFNIKAEDMAMAVDQITGVTIASKFTINDYELALGQAGGMAAAVGVSFEDFNAVIAATAPSFNSGSDAGTSFKTFLTTLIPKSNEAEDAMRGLGLITTDYERMARDMSQALGKEVEPSIMALEKAFVETAIGAEAATHGQKALDKSFGALRAQYEENQFFDDNTGALKDMDQVAGLLQDAFKDLTEEQRNEIAATIYGTDAMRTAFALIDGGTPLINDMKKIIGDTSAEESAATRMDTLTGSWEIFQGIVETLTLGIGDKFLPVVRKVIDWATGLAEIYGPPVIEWAGKLADVVIVAVDWFIEAAKTGQILNDKFAALPEPIRKTIKAATDFIDITKGAIKWIGDIIGQFVSWQDVLIVVAGVIATVVIPAIWAFITATAPVAAVFAGLVAASALLRHAWEGDWLGIRTKTGEAFTYLTTTFTGLGTAIRQFGGGALQEIRDWATGNETNFASVRAIWEAAKISFGAAFTDMGNKLKEWGAIAWSEFKERFPGAASALQGAFLSISTKFGELWAVVHPLIQSGITAFQDLVAKWRAGGTDMGTALQLAKTVLDGIWTIMITAAKMSITTMIDTLKLVAHLLSGDWAGAWRTAKDMVSGVLENLKTIVGTAFNTILQVLGVNIEDFNRWRDKTIEILTQMGQGVMNKMTEMKNNVINPVRDFIEDTRNRIETWRSFIAQKYQDIVGDIKTKMDSLKTNVVEPVKSFIDTTKELIGTWRTNITDIWDKLSGNVLAYMAQVKASVIEPVKGFITDTAERITGWVLWVIENWQKIKDAAKEKWDAIKTAVVDPVRDFIQSTMEKIGSWKEWLVTKFTEVWTAVKAALTPANWLAWGRDLIQGLWDGLKEKWNSLSTWFSGVWSNLVDRFKNFFGIASPSKLFEEYGGWTIEGFVNGITKGIPLANSALSSLGTSLTNVMGVVTSSLAMQVQSTMTSIVEGVRYGVGQVNLATADVVAQSKAAESAAFANWERMKTAANEAAASAAKWTTAVNSQDMTALIKDLIAKGQLNPAHFPTSMGGTGTQVGTGPNGEIILAPTGPSAPMPSTTPIVAPPVVDFNTLTTMTALGDVLGGDNDAFRTIAYAIQDFGEDINSLLPNTLSGKTDAEKAAISTLIYDPLNKRIDTVLAAVQTLVQAIISRGLGSQINVAAAPGDATDNRQELQQLVSYLNALYAT